jgi:hypothetical protein
MTMRVLAGLVYLVATTVWAFKMAMVQDLRCDDSCTAAGFARDWHDNADSWQYGVVGWLGAAGLGLALLAVALSFRRRWLGLAALFLHGAVFTANCLVLYLGRSIYGSFVPFVLGATVVALAGFVAVGGQLGLNGRSRPQAPYG